MKNFFERKGFYIVLALCVTSIGVAGYVNFSNNDTLSGDLDQAQSVASDIVLPVIDEPVENEQSLKKEIPSIDSNVLQENDEVFFEEETVETVKQTEATKVEVSKPSQELFISPVEKTEIIQANSMDELVKDLTMNDWRTHNATDYAVNSGDRILAISGGVVSQITTSDQYGTIIEIAHADGLITKTFGLNSDTTVNIDDKVIAGDVIGTAMGEILFEQKLGSHIHVEATVNGKNVDIETYINK